MWRREGSEGCRSKNMWGWRHSCKRIVFAGKKFRPNFKFWLEISNLGWNDLRNSITIERFAKISQNSVLKAEIL